MSQSSIVQNIMIRLASQPWIQHLAFWGLSFYVLFKLFNLSEGTEVTDLIYTSLFHISLTLLVYFNVFLLIPKILSKNQYLLYLFVSLVVVNGMVFVNQFTFTTLADWIFPGYYFISYYNYWDILQFMAAYWAISTVLKLSKAWFLVNRQERQIQQLTQEKISAELVALKAQLNPHFLFNSLNGIYSLALYKDEETPEALLKLSQCLRYVLYDCKVDQIPIEKEVQLLENYIDLQGMRKEEDLQVRFTKSGRGAAVTIAPLMLLPLLENAFKFVRANSDGAFFIDIDLEIGTSDLVFTINNSVGEKQNNKNQPGGVGIENLKQRLALLYPKLHTLEIQTSPKNFKCHLSIQHTDKKP